jgi:phosphotransferase system  glucose/maltose/N-acetylglucosamine-specific IIC component
MTRTIALRASALFVVLTILFGAVGLGSQAVVAEAVFLISGSLFALMLLFALATPDHAGVPVRVRRIHARR